MDEATVDNGENAKDVNDPGAPDPGEPKRLNMAEAIEKLKAARAARGEPAGGEEPGGETGDSLPDQGDGEPAAGGEQTDGGGEPPSTGGEEPRTQVISEEQQVKLRVRQEAQRLRAEAKKERDEALRIKAEAQAEVERARKEVEEAKRLQAEVDAIRKKAKENPYDYLTETTGSSFDDLVRGKLEENTPAAKVTMLERQNAAILRSLDELRQERVREREASEAAKKEEETRRQAAEVEANADASRKAFVELALKSAEKYPVMASLAKRAPWALIAQGYGAHFQFKTDHGREGTQEELLASMEKAFEDDEDGGQPPTSKPAPAGNGKKPGAVRKTGADGPAPPPDPDEMTPEQKRAYAIAELRRRNQAREAAERKGSR